MLSAWVGTCGCYSRIDAKNTGVMDATLHVGGHKLPVCWIWTAGEYSTSRCPVLCVRRSVALIAGRVSTNLLLMNFTVALMEQSSDSPGSD